MITVDMITAQLEKLTDSISYAVNIYDDEIIIHVLVEDFDGFDDQWREIIRPVDWKAVRALETWLETHADSIDEECDYYYFGDITVDVQRASAYI
jgi:hypothetical protein